MAAGMTMRPLALRTVFTERSGSNIDDNHTTDWQPRSKMTPIFAMSMMHNFGCHCARVFRAARRRWDNGEMRTELVFSSISQIETELLAVTAVDTQTAKGTDAKPQPELLTSDATVKSAAAAVLASGEFKAGANETLLL